jgi:hypothetical protein
MKLQVVHTVASKVATGFYVIAETAEELELLMYLSKQPPKFTTPIDHTGHEIEGAGILALTLDLPTRLWSL